MMMRRIYGIGLLLLLTATVAGAQSAASAGTPLYQQLLEEQKFLASQDASPTQLDRYLKAKQSAISGKFYLQGRWWSNPQTVEMLGMTSDQVKKMDDIFQQHRLRLIDLNAALAKEEAILEPLVAADQPDDAKVLPQIDRVAQARAELEKANSRML